MSLLKPIENGRMYPGWWRWNPIGGCEHNCSYCSIKRIEKRAGKDMTTPVFRNGENGTKNYMNDNLGSGRKIFVCSSGDMWGEWVKSENIRSVLNYCREYLSNEYLFLTKNPKRYGIWPGNLCSLNCIAGATIETDADAIGGWASYAPGVLQRLGEMELVREVFELRTMISIEPIMKFTERFAERLRTVDPYIVYIGVDSGHNNLPEPTADELRGLIAELRTFTDVRLKKGIERILPEARA